jgi:hypothetical protein
MVILYRITKLRLSSTAQKFEDSVHDVLRVIQNARIEINGGSLVSHYGNNVTRSHPTLVT